jgi:hypothetical protein
MNRILFVFISLMLSVKGLSQANKITIGFDYSVQSFFDRTPSFPYVSYERNIGNKLSIGLEYHTITDSWYSGGNVVGVPKTQAGIENESAFYDDAVYFDIGFTQFSTNPNHLLYKTGDINFSYKLFSGKKSNAYVGIGPSLTYGEREYISLGITGYFDLGSNSTKRYLQLFVPYYLRFMALGLNTKISYSYDLNERISIGGRLTFHKFFESRNTYYASVGINVVTKF